MTNGTSRFVFFVIVFILVSMLSLALFTKLGKKEEESNFPGPGPRPGPGPGPRPGPHPGPHHRPHHGGGWRGRGSWGYPYPYYGGWYSTPIIVDEEPTCYKNISVKTEGFGTRTLCLSKGEYISKLHKDLDALRDKYRNSNVFTEAGIRRKIEAVKSELRMEGVSV